jgi:hypothetical protein
VVEAPDGWGGAKVARPVIEEGWPRVQPEDHSYLSEEEPLGPDGWPDLSLPSRGVLVTMTTTIYLRCPMVHRVSLRGGAH